MMETQWFLTRDGQTIAQYSSDGFKRAVAKGKIRPDDYIRRSDSSNFIKAADFLPQTYQPSRSFGGSLTAALVVIAAMLGGGWYAVNTYAPVLVQAAFSNLDLAKVEETRQADISQALLSDGQDGRFFQALNEKDPQAFHEVVTYMSGFAGEAPADLVPQARAYATKSIIEPRSRFLDDDGKIAMLTLSRDVGGHLATSNARLCIDHALGRSFGDLRPYLTPELAAREEDLLFKMLTAPQQTYELQPAKDLQALNTRVAVGLYETYGDRINLLDLEKVPEGQEEAACRMFGAYLDGVLGLPQPDRVALVRAIVLDPGRLTSTGGASAEAAPSNGSTAAADGAGAADATVGPDTGLPEEPGQPADTPSSPEDAQPSPEPSAPE